MEIVSISVWFFLSEEAQNSFSRIIALSWKEEQPWLSSYTALQFHFKRLEVCSRWKSSLPRETQPLVLGGFWALIARSSVSSCTIALDFVHLKFPLRLPPARLSCLAGLSKFSVKVPLIILISALDMKLHRLSAPTSFLP